jgi:hypothetical protein
MTTVCAIRVTNVVTTIDTTACASRLLFDVAEVADLGGSWLVNLFIQLQTPGLDAAATTDVPLLLPCRDHAGSPHLHHGMRHPRDQRRDHDRHHRVCQRSDVRCSRGR